MRAFAASKVSHNDRDFTNQIGLQARTLEPIQAHILGYEAIRVPYSLLSENGVAIVAACRCGCTLKEG